MKKLAVAGYDNRGDAKYPFGFIVFNDETRITYAALIPQEKGRDAWGLPSDVEDHGLTDTHIRLARTYVEGHLPLPAAAIAQYEAEKKEQESVHV